jgi:hypothetical protein
LDPELKYCWRVRIASTQMPSIPHQGANCEGRTCHETAH